jgi:hypothetical protein
VRWHRRLVWGWGSRFRWRGTAFCVYPVSEVELKKFFVLDIIQLSFSAILMQVGAGGVAEEAFML